MKNAMQLKAIIKNIAKRSNISAQLVMQNFMMEKLLERISLSEYKNNFILKGGFLIASMVGINTRATMDMDATIQGIPVTQQIVEDMFVKISQIKLDDEITFSFVNISEIREEDEYVGYRVSLSANFPPMAIPLKLDITTGDKITPSEIMYEYKLLLEERSINILAYNLETILAEKIETIITRSDQNTRPRDFYDVFILQKLLGNNIDFKSLREAIEATAEKRNSTSIIKNHKNIIQVIRASNEMRQRWLKYQKDFDYAKDINFEDICDVVLVITNQCIV